MTGLQLEAQLQESMARVDSVRGQLQSMQESYGEKFEEFSSTITKSNEVGSAGHVHGSLEILPENCSRDIDGGAKGLSSLDNGQMAGVSPILDVSQIKRTSQSRRIVAISC